MPLCPTTVTVTTKERQTMKDERSNDNIKYFGYTAHTMSFPIVKKKTKKVGQTDSIEYRGSNFRWCIHACTGRECVLCVCVCTCVIFFFLVIFLIFNLCSPFPRTNPPTNQPTGMVLFLLPSLSLSLSQSNSQLTIPITGSSSGTTLTVPR
jgi:hypothetical protein